MTHSIYDGSLFIILLILIYSCSTSPNYTLIKTWNHRMDSVVDMLESRITSAACTPEQKLLMLDKAVIAADSLQMIQLAEMDSLGPQLTEGEVKEMENASRDRMRRTEEILLQAFPELKDQPLFK